MGMVTEKQVQHLIDTLNVRFKLTADMFRELETFNMTLVALLVEMGIISLTEFEARQQVAEQLRENQLKKIEEAFEQQIRDVFKN